MNPTKVLYVEDELYLAKIVQDTLETRGYEVEWISDGAKAVDRFAEWEPDICVLDVMLPKMDGFTLAKMIRAQNKTTPIIFLTAKDQTTDLVEGFGAGGNDYVKKPFSMQELMVRIENLLKITRDKQEAESINEPVSIASFTYDPIRLELKWDDDVRRLSHRESEILKLLCAHRNTTIERKILLTQVWGDDSFFNSRTLDVYIRKLRKYFEPDDRIEIVTLKGVGYQFLVSGIIKGT